MSYPNVNEAGEPLISGEALRYEQYLDSDPTQYYCDECGFSHVGGCNYVEWEDD